jgi:hypothetical protein
MQIRPLLRKQAAAYLPADTRSEVMVVKVAFNCEPMEFTAVMIAMQIAAVINPYSIAVAADSSRRNLSKALIMRLHRKRIAPAMAT